MNDDLSFIRDEEWPMWPLLPMVELKGPSIRKCGVLVSGQGPVVHVGYVWCGIDLDTCKKVSYDSFEELLKHWRVD